ncbi:hypothetical protein [Marinactinospora rubrisoli]|uniref:Uncharacterized protein n=1 Tax=Marinactinospora rubrisoli TaxID=2715399 RepID=A0ABW2KMW1_9ACTN
MSKDDAKHRKLREQRDEAWQIANWVRDELAPHVSNEERHRVDRVDRALRRKQGRDR